MKQYIVGGAVRDELLGLAIKDRDYVVVGSHESEMLAAGFQAVGKDFPVFLHPKTHEEYALARTERKTSLGYKGFTVYASPDVTLEEDLARRDLTINAIAKDELGNLIDPFHGQADIKRKIFRHVSPAFSEDPVRILRVARFAARFPDFIVADETNQLMQTMVLAGEVDALVPERVWQELSKGLMEIKPSRMFAVLRACGALVKILPELDRLWGIPQTEKYHPEVDTGIHMMLVMDYAASQQFSLPIRFAALTHDFGKGTTPSHILPSHIGHEDRSVNLLKAVVKRLRVPNDCAGLAQIVAKFHGKMHHVKQMRDATRLTLLYDLDAFRQPERFQDFLKACECDLRGRTGFETAAFEEASLLLNDLDKAKKIDAGEIAKQCVSPSEIKEAIFTARLAAINTP
jgi:tRNA nucleotidyltransferase (CCA-adding enzyme)